MAKDHGFSVKNDKEYEGLRGGTSSHSSQSSKSSGNRAQKAAAGRNGGKKSS